MPSHAQRLDKLVRAFMQRYQRRPAIIAAAPGRVNLIGEHTDYNGLPVLPMAIDRTVLIAAAARDDRRVELGNVDERFAPRRYALTAAISPYEPGDWGNYHKAAAQGLLGMLGAAALNGGEFLVEGQVPAAAGLSSSSALTVASALALLAVNECEVPPAALAQLMADSERYVGTMSGGMDQAICLLARAGSALRIDFDPLRTRPVPVPTAVAIVVCDSLVVAAKAGAARAAYNQRVTECRRGCTALARGLGLPEDTPHLGALRRARPDVATDQLIDALASSDAAAVVPRVRHVLREADRVDAAESALAAGDWRAFGALMNASHASCRDDYEISCPDLDELVRIAHGAGAAGARLTGAGFGGCTVNLVAHEDVPAFLDRVDWDYYRPRGVLDGRQHSWVFAPSGGATVYM